MLAIIPLLLSYKKQVLAQICLLLLAARNNCGLPFFQDAQRLCFVRVLTKVTAFGPLEPATLALESTTSEWGSGEPYGSQGSI